MKRTKAKRVSRERLPEVDEGQIIAMLRLTPTERLEKLRSYMAFAEELQRAAGLRQNHRKPQKA
jgi:hypothetical protein